MYSENEEPLDYDRYASLTLTNYEVWSIVIGILLLTISIIGWKKYPNFAPLSLILGFISIICLVPLVTIILSIASKVLKYAMILGFIILCLYQAYKMATKYLKE